MIPTLKELLTQHLLDDGKPLFETTAALGKAIIFQKSNEYTNARSVSTLIGFIFCGKRTCPKSLREPILKATRMRLSKKSQQIQQEWNDRINQAIDFLNNEITKSHETRSEREEDQFESFLHHAELVQKHFIITPLAAEHEKGIKRAEEISAILLRRLGISPKNDTLPTTQYWFLFPSRKTGDQFWDRLRENALLFTNESSTTSWIDERIKFLEKNNYLQIYIVPPFICGCPMVVYNPDNTRDFAAFSFNYHPNNVIDMIRWDNVSILRWKENVFERFVWQNCKTKQPFLTESDSAEFMKNNPGKFAGYRCPIPFAFDF